MERLDPEIIEKREEFREHLTLGVVKALEKVPMVRDVVLPEHQPSDTIAITSWEQRYSTMLPHEIKDFYLATDGFKLTWNFNVNKLAITIQISAEIAIVKKLGDFLFKITKQQNFNFTRHFVTALVMGSGT